MKQGDERAAYVVWMRMGDPPRSGFVQPYAQGFAANGAPLGKYVSLPKPMDTIGIIRTPYKTKQDCPIQPLYTSDNPAYVEVFERYADGLKDVETFSHLYLLYQFDRADAIQLVRTTFLDDTPHGIYASRHPCRPNGIGMSIVKLVRRDGNVLVVEGADMLNETPLLDIKPYIPKYDAIPSASEGWTANKQWRQKPEGRE